MEIYSQDVAFCQTFAQDLYCMDFLDICFEAISTNRHDFSVILKWCGLDSMINIYSKISSSPDICRQGSIYLSALGSS